MQPCFLKNATGYRNLMALVSAAHLEDRAHGAVGVMSTCLARMAPNGLICLTGGPDGPVNQLLSAGLAGLAEDVLARIAF